MPFLDGHEAMGTPSCSAYKSDLVNSNDAFHFLSHK
jgi:hypothetical protein